MLFDRNASGFEVTAASQMLDSGVPLVNLPLIFAENATGQDKVTLTAKAIFSLQATENFEHYLGQADVSERTLLEVERACLTNLTNLEEIPVRLESIVKNIQGLFDENETVPLVVATLDTDFDTGVKGDNRTTLGTVQVEITGIAPGSLVWLDKNNNAAFDPGIDNPVINNKIDLSLDEGANTFLFYEMVNKVTANPDPLSALSIVGPSALTLIRAQDGAMFPSPPPPPVVDDMVKGVSVYIVDDTISLEFASAVNWAGMDANGDGILSVGKPGSGAELQLTSGTNPVADQNVFDTDISSWEVDVPDYGSTFLTINNVGFNPGTDYTGKLTLLLVGLPSLSGSLSSNVAFTLDIG